MDRWNGTTMIDLATAKRWTGTTMVDLTTAKRWSGTTWQDLILPGGSGVTLIAHAVPGAAVGSAVDNNLFTNVQTNTVTVNVVGGSAPYSHLWTKVSGDSAPQPSATTSNAVLWSANLGRNVTYQATWKDTITDAFGNTTELTVPVTLSHSVPASGGGGGPDWPGDTGTQAQ